MNIDEISPMLCDPVLEEGWVALSYTYAGVFIFDGCFLGQERIKNDIANSLAIIKANRGKKIPRPLSKRIVVAVYLVDECDETILNYFKTAKFRGAGWSAHSLLYHGRNSEIIFKEAVQNETMLIYKTLDRLFNMGVCLCQQVNCGSRPK